MGDIAISLTALICTSSYCVEKQTASYERATSKTEKIARKKKKSTADSGHRNSMEKILRMMMTPGCTRLYR